jgi:hypothetical protein
MKKILALIPTLALVACTSTTEPGMAAGGSVADKVARGNAEPTDWRCTKDSSPTYAHATSDEKGELIQQGYTCTKNF